ncbi:MAG: AAA family ATPase [Candidatus Aenigmatarchaeota archaeon]
MLVSSGVKLRPKSNLCDAICFVLGRTSAKSLRAERLHELIYHGGDGSSPAQYASVVLYLDNSNKIFPFDDQEVSITRKVNRKGVCVYKIQGKTTTREKVLELLSAARIYPDGHNIILQGDVTNIIEMNPIERRQIIDEISGIAEYNEKREKAKKDLEAVDARLREAEIIISERYDTFKRLEEERNAALKYQNLQRQLIILKASLAHKRYCEFEKNLKTIEEEIQKKENELLEFEKKAKEIENRLEETEKKVKEFLEKFSNFSDLIEVDRKASLLRINISTNETKIEFNKKEIERLDELIKRIQEINDIETDIKERFSRSVNEIIKQNLKGVFGTIAGIIKVPEKYRIAIEIAAGQHLNDIVVDNEETAKFCIEFLKREKIGRATFLPLNKIKPRELKEKEMLKKNGVLGIASKLVKFDKKFLPAIEFVLGNTLIVKDLEVARTIGIGKVRMVTLDGDLIERSGAMTGGYLIREKIRQFGRDKIEEYIKTKEALEKEIERIRKENEEAKRKLEEYSKVEKTKEFLDFKKFNFGAETELEKLKIERKNIYERMYKLQTEVGRLKIQKAKIETELENLKIELLQYEGVEPMDKSIRVLEQETKEVQQGLLSLGPVNFKAIEQYEKFKSEFDNYKEKYEKILEEKKAVLDMIQKIEEKRMEVFNNCLKEVSKQFNEVFNRMTNGNASLELEDPLNLDSGLIIQANPGGKTLTNIDSLSGGEKSLTALAFLFAIQQFKPAPFYILDEVDAALDKENTKKVAELIKSLSKDAQFLIITHNEQMIKYGDVIYGVTMEKSESKILSLEMPPS